MLFAPFLSASDKRAPSALRLSAVRGLGLETTLHSPALGAAGPAGFFLVSSSLCGFCSETTYGLSSSQPVLLSRGTEEEQRGGVISPGSHSQWPSRARAPNLNTYWRKCFFIRKMGTIPPTSWREIEVPRGEVTCPASPVSKGQRQDSNPGLLELHHFPYWVFCLPSQLLPGNSGARAGGGRPQAHSYHSPCLGETLSERWGP